MANTKIIAQAAEAIIIKEGNKVTKKRVKKGYRIPEIDEKLRKLRTRSESKLLEKASKLISVPKILKTDEKSKEIEMEFIEGKKLSENLDKLENKNEIMEKVGEEIAKLHDADIIHGDLTTSNMIYVKEADETIKQPNKLSTVNNRKSYDSEISEQEELMKENKFKIYFIDFGLGFISKRMEDRAVDLHLIRQALEAKHFQHWEKLYHSMLKGYKSKDKDKILEQLKKVEGRGRYRKNAQ